ncbi:excisionase family DNA-binding protein [Massilia sp. CFBP9012]|uniref:GAF domain-containing protein n=1 Tax=Massilia sp. CFBP9012 TaxID=3096531 RepID=UPI002A6ACF37|nr:GAF domain-containing protein [Massilia sp. CFBP9012]MDY0975193.1 excisionase family DNA-binding protein [Massilia sp. CFBP9012]
MMTRPDDDPILTTREAARLLGVAVSTAQVWMEGGALPTWKTPGGHRRVRLSAVTQLMRQREASLPTAQAERLSGEFLPTQSPAYPVASNEAQRLTALAATKLMDSAEEEVFDRLTWLASHVTECPMALLTLLSGRRQWFKSRIGIERRQTPREVAFCSYTIMQDGAFVVEDAGADPRFAANPLVTGAPHIRFYAGYPVRGANGLALGSLCVLDREPRRLRERELRALRELAAIASDEVRRRG